MFLLRHINICVIYIFIIFNVKKNRLVMFSLYYIHVRFKHLHKLNHYDSMCKVTVNIC